MPKCKLNAVIRINMLIIIYLGRYKYKQYKQYTRYASVNLNRGNNYKVINKVMSNVKLMVMYCI